jgi:hypothetical protein
VLDIQHIRPRLSSHRRHNMDYISKRPLLSTAIGVTVALASAIFLHRRHRHRGTKLSKEGAEAAILLEQATLRASNQMIKVAREKCAAAMTPSGPIVWISY